jgi:hypothetical protein
LAGLRADSRAERRVRVRVCCQRWLRGVISVVWQMNDRASASRCLAVLPTRPRPCSGCGLLDGRDARPGARHAGPYFPDAALNLTTSSAGVRPRSLTSMPCDLAQAPDLGAVRPAGTAPAPALRGPPCTRSTPSSHDVPRERCTQRLGVPGVQVDLVLCAVQPETDGALGFAAIDVVDEQRLDLLNRPRTPSR